MSKQRGHGVNDHLYVRRFLLRFTCALPVALLSGWASAADSPGTDAESQLQTVTVTARYRSENLQETPIAITALTADGLEARGFNNIVDVTKVAPNVTLQQSGSNGGKAAVAYIRGVGQSDFTLAFEPGVGFYLDDVYFGTIFGAMFDLGDIDRVEVLRGPQGTLFGKNNEGGAVRLFSTVPKGDDSGYFEAGYGNYNRFMVKAAYDFGLIPDKLSLRLSGGMNRIDGYMRRYDFVCAHPDQAGNLPVVSVHPDCKTGTLGGDEVQTFRASLRWTPNDDVEVLFSADGLKDRGEAAPAKTLTVVQTPPLADYNANVVMNPSSTFYVGIPIDSRFVTNSPYTTYATFKDQSTGISFDPVNNVDSWGLGNTVNWKLPGGLQLKTVLGYRAYSGSFVYDALGAPLSTVIYANPDFTHNQFSEELNLSGSLADNKLDWTTGIYYYDGYSRQGHGPVMLTSAEIVPPTGSPFFCEIGCYGLNFVTNDPVIVKNKSAFVHAAYHFTSQLTAELGARYSDESKKYTFSRVLLPTNPVDPLFTAAFDADFPFLAGFADNPSATSGTTRWDPKVALQYSWTPDFMTYVQYATGFKGGGINPHPVFVEQAVPFKAEKLSSYEVGAKSQFFGNRVRLNGAAFSSNYKDLQITVIGPAGALIVQNAGHIRISGVEGELEAEPAPRFVLNSSFGFLNYKTIDLGTAAGVVGGPTESSKPAYVPKWKVNFGAQYGVAFAGGSQLTPRIDYTYQSEVFNDPANNPLARQEPYGLLDARVTWESPQREWQAAVALQNALDKVYYINKLDNTGSFGVVDGQPGMPRTVFVSLKRKF
ncbi:MAG TPA: TonB-dependent receptor [Steroidobacteraceae bacterium]|nr:TonB-dependent receptor [Steroidobacteraceae bacterium]